MLTRKACGPSPELQDALELIETRRRLAGVSLDRYDVHAARAAQIEYASTFPPDVAVRRQNYAGVDCVWAIPEQAGDEQRILYMHGGGFVIGGWMTHSGVATWLASYCRRPVLFVEYRRAPEHRFPAAFDDALTAYRSILAEGPRGSSPADSVLVVGDSAGAGLALSLCQQLDRLRLRGPRALALIGAWVNLDRESSAFLQSSPSRWQMAEQYLGDADPRDPRISPLHGTLRGLPPTLIQVGSDEVLTAENLELRDRLLEAGVDVSVEVWADMPHVWHRFAAGVPEALAAIRGIAEYFGRVNTRFEREPRPASSPRAAR